MNDLFTLKRDQLSRKLKKMSTWKTFKASGSYKRKVRENIRQIHCSSSPQNNVTSHAQHHSAMTPENCGPAYLESKELEDVIMHGDISRGTKDVNVPIQVYPEVIDQDPSNTSENQEDEAAADMELLKDLKLWALTFNIRHTAVKELLTILNRRLSDTLPQDPRTLLKTTQTILLNPVGDGHYWPILLCVL